MLITERANNILVVNYISIEKVIYLNTNLLMSYGTQQGKKILCTECLISANVA